MAFCGFGLMCVVVLGGRWLVARPMTYEIHRARDAVSSFPDDEERVLENNFDEFDIARPVAVDPSDSNNVEVNIEQSAPLAFFPSVRTEPHEVNYQDAEKYLMVGVDRTRGRWGRADTIAIAVFDRESGHAGIVSVPRDLYVLVPDHGPARINATLRIASRKDGVNPLEVLRGVVEEVLSMKIDHVVVGDLRAFESTVGALGGLDVDVACPIVDDFVDSRTESGRRLLSVEAGRVHMDGVTAAMYARSRHGRSDWDRSRRQHAILSALRRRLSEVGVTRWLPIMGRTLEEGVITTMSRLELLQLLRRVSRLDEKRFARIASWIAPSGASSDHRGPLGSPAEFR